MKEEYNSPKKNIHKFLRGELDTHDETKLLNWANASAENKEQFLANQKALQKNLTESPSDKTREEWAKLSARLDINKQNNHRSLVLRKFGYAAGIVAAFIVGILIASLNPFQNKSELNIAISQTFSTPDGARSNFELPDGSMVWLNAGSQLTFSTFGTKERKVSLQGEAYFKVVHDEARPFLVSTSYGTVKDLGTSFNVKAYSDDQFTTTVEEGLVSVLAENSTNDVQVNPGQQAVLKSENGKIAISNVETEIYTCWKDGILIFKKDALAEIVKKLERWYNVDIYLVQNVKLKNYRFTGTIEMETLPEVLELIRITAPINYKYDAKERTVRIDMKD